MLNVIACLVLKSNIVTLRRTDVGLGVVIFHCETQVEVRSHSDDTAASKRMQEELHLAAAPKRTQEELHLRTVWMTGAGRAC